MSDDSCTARVKAHRGEALRWNPETEIEFGEGVIAGFASRPAGISISMEVRARPAQMRRIAIGSDRIDAMAGIGRLVCGA